MTAIGAMGAGQETAYLKYYAQQKGISENQAKQELQSLYGNPGETQNTQETSSNNSDSSIFQTTGDPQKDLATYAQQSGLTEDEAKIALQELYGEPEQTDNNQSNGFMDGIKNFFARFNPSAQNENQNNATTDNSPQDMGMNPEDMGLSPEDMGMNPEDMGASSQQNAGAQNSGASPQDMGMNPEDMGLNPEDLKKYQA